MPWTVKIDTALRGACSRHIPGAMDGDNVAEYRRGRGWNFL